MAQGHGGGETAKFINLDASEREIRLIKMDWIRKARGG